MTTSYVITSRKRRYIHRKRSSGNCQTTWNLVSEDTCEKMSSREIFNRMVAQRDALELEADAIASELNSPGPNNELPAGIKTPLIDKEGFPRGDIDLFNVKAKRQRLAVINTDHKVLMSEIERVLHMIHCELPGVDEMRATLRAAAVQADKVQEFNATTKAFAIIDEILDTSPAKEAGFINGDELLAFGRVTAQTSDALNAVPSVVRDSVNKRIPVMIRRGGMIISVAITPKTWGGRGLLGCHLTPITQM